jgi:tetratricopeptide (TPR) repeat protein
MLYYFLGHYWSKLGNKEKAMEYYSQAQKKPYIYCFPYRDEEEKVLTTAIAADPGDAKALYYLGNLYYESQPEKAVALWEKSQAVDNSFYIVQRNLAWAALQDNDLEKALALYKNAFENNRQDARLIYEYDLVCKSAKMTPQDRYDQIFKENHEITKTRSETLISEFTVLNYLGKYDEVIDIIQSNEFIESEGSTRFRDVYLNAFILRSLSKIDEGNVNEAIADLQNAMTFPLGRSQQRNAQMNYLMGDYYERLGKGKLAKTYFEKASVELTGETEFLYYNGLALAKLGQKEKALEKFRMLNEIANRESDSDFYRSFEVGSMGDARKAQKEYMKGLAALGMGNKAEARSAFERAVELDPGHLWARIQWLVVSG